MTNTPRRRPTASTPVTSVDVDGKLIDAVMVDVTYEITGDFTGTWHEVPWLASENALPVRIERDLDLSSLATFTEHSELVLTSITPKR